MDYSLLVVDDGFNQYDTPQCLGNVAARLRDEGDNWCFENCRQEDFPIKMQLGRYDAFLIDNDFGEGVLSLVRVIGGHIPIGYITSYDMDGLRNQYRHVPAARHLDPGAFERVTLIQKPGKNVSVDLRVGELERQLYGFLKSAAAQRDE